MLKVTCAIIIHQNKILVAQRNPNSDHPLKWEFPGGKLNPRETIRECVIREIKEELDIEIEVRQSMIAIKHDYGFMQVELIPFICNIKSGEIKLFEHNAVMWVFPENLEKIDFTDADKTLIQHPGNKDILKKYFGKNMNDTR